MDSKDVGKYIKAIREEKKISQRKLAEMIGRGESTIGNYETGATDIPCSVILDMARVLGVGPEEFFGVSQDSFNPLMEQAHERLLEMEQKFVGWEEAASE